MTPFDVRGLDKKMQVVTITCIFFAQTLAVFEKSSTFALAIGLWCNGNTTDSGPVIHGSSPCSPTKKEVQKTSFFYASIKPAHSITHWMSSPYP